MMFLFRLSRASVFAGALIFRGNHGRKASTTD